MAATDGVERFPATGGRVTGIAILAMSAGARVQARGGRGAPRGRRQGQAPPTPLRWRPPAPARARARPPTSRGWRCR